MARLKQIRVHKSRQQHAHQLADSPEALLWALQDTVHCVGFERDRRTDVAQRVSRVSVKRVTPNRIQEDITCRISDQNASAALTRRRFIYSQINQCA